MLTPQFSCSQSDEAVILVIKTPYVKATDVEFFIDKCEFRLHINPYFLRLTFPHEVIENGKETARYDVGKGEITVSLPKAVHGQHFEDLDLLSKLLMPKAAALSVQDAAAGAARAGKGPLIEVLSSNEEMEEDGDGDEDEEEDEKEEDFDWELPQELPEPDLLTGVKYGFNNSYSGYASHVAELGRDIIDIDNIDQSTPTSRRQERLEKEDAKFDEDYYMSDFLHDDEIKRVCKFKPKFWSALKKLQSEKGKQAARLIVEMDVVVPVVEALSVQDAPVEMNMVSAGGNLPVDMDTITPEHAALIANLRDQLMDPSKETITTASMESETVSSNEPSAAASKEPVKWQPEPTATEAAPSTSEPEWLTFTETERQEMISLPHRKLLLEPTSSKHLYLGLVDILFAYCYDHRTTEGDFTVESAWTIAKLSPTLSCFETFGTLDEVLVACIRRSLAYPLYRNLSLCTKVIEDVAVLLKLGKRALLKALLGVRRTLRGDEACFVFDRLYVEDYCLWIQSDFAKDAVLKGLGSEVNHYVVDKSKIGWDLGGLEELAKEIGDEEDESMQE
ncbi:Hsp90 cochaperone shq1 [Chytriomyces hyalinus]|nr:Hsp90 cochaperone shq1 [Chytriomyces hyalinus]